MSNNRAYRAMLMAALAGAPSCSREKCPDLTGVPCESLGHLYCDPCEQSWNCVESSPQNVRVRSELACDCRTEDGTVDTADSGCR